MIEEGKIGLGGGKRRVPESARGTRHRGLRESRNDGGRNGCGVVVNIF